MALPDLDTLYSLKRDGIIELFVLEHNGIIYRFCNWKKTNGLDVTFQGQTYTAIPIMSKGFEVATKGQFPTPELVIGNVLGVITSIVLTGDDLVGAKVTRKRALIKNLDGMPEANPTREFLPTEWYISRKVAETNTEVQFLLRTPLDRGVQSMIPRSIITKYTCVWQYRKIGCEYSGPAVATIEDVPTSDPALDQCSNTQKGCELRFGSWSELRIRAIPSIDDV